MKQKDFDIEKFRTELAEKEADINVLSETFEREYEVLRLENERNVQELQKVFKENIEKTRPSASTKPQSQTPDDN